jgi:hypothetical protein
MSGGCVEGGGDESCPGIICNVTGDTEESPVHVNLTLRITTMSRMFNTGQNFSL